MRILKFVSKRGISLSLVACGLMLCKAQAQYKSGSGSGFAVQTLVLRKPTSLPHKDSVLVYPIPCHSWQELKVNTLPLKIQVFRPEGVFVGEFKSFAQCTAARGLYWVKLYLSEHQLTTVKVLIL